MVNPLFEAWHSYMQEDVTIHLENIKQNRLYWKTLIENSSVITPLVIKATTSQHSMLKIASANASRENIKLGSDLLSRSIDQKRSSSQLQQANSFVPPDLQVNGSRKNSPKGSLRSRTSSMQSGKSRIK